MQIVERISCISSHEMASSGQDANNPVRLATSWNRKRRRRRQQQHLNNTNHLMLIDRVYVQPINQQVSSVKSICAKLLLLANLFLLVAIIPADSDNLANIITQQNAQQQQQQQIPAGTHTTSGHTPAPSTVPDIQTTQHTSSSSLSLSLLQAKATATTITIRDQPTSISGALVPFPSSLAFSSQAPQEASSVTATTETTTTTTTMQPSQTTHAKRDLTSTTTNARWQQQHQLERDATARANKLSGNVCQVNDGESVAILEIEESRGSDTSQLTSPGELPISGSVNAGEIELKIESETHNYFRLQDKSLRLIRPLDRDAVLRENSTQLAQQPITSIYLQVSCADKRPTGGGGAGATTPKKVIIPVLVKVLDLNDNAPRFSQSSYSIEVNELAPVGTIVMDQFAFAIDLDSASNGQVEYSLLGSRSDSNSSLIVTNSTNAGQVSPKPTNQRLIQRAPLESSTPKPTVLSTTTTTTTSSPFEAPSSQTITAPSGGLETTEETRPTTRPGVGSSGGPTINLDSEPIMNGPMEEPDEDESDESLLAAMNSSGNSSDTDSELSAFASSLGARARSYLSLALARPAGTRRRKRRGVSAETRPALTTTISTRRLGDSAPWTNLMMISNEDLRSLDDGHGHASTAATTRLGGAGEHATSGPSGPSEWSALDYFALELSPQTNRPVLRLKRQLDYETQRVHQLTLVATDRAANKRERLTSQARIVIRVLDGDDQPPAFVLDQVGCATQSLPRTTTPIPLSDTPSLPATLSGISKEQPVPSSNQNNLQLRSFMVTDENFDFGDTLGLDDTPLDEDAGRTRRVPSRPVGGTQQLNPQRSPLPVVESAHDYSCLPSTMSLDDGSHGSSQAEYFATVVSGDSDYLLRIVPQAIRARDRDELNAPIRYSLIEVDGATPSNFSHYFQINPLDATIKQVAPVERSQVSEFTLLIKAQEQSYNRLFSVAKLTIDVLPTDKNPPVLAPNSYSGYVDENSPLGTRVQVVRGGRPQSGSENSTTTTTSYLHIGVLDSDTGAADRTGSYTSQAKQTSNSRIQYEFETTSDAFKVDREGYVYVNRYPLDRDAPEPDNSMSPSGTSGSVHMFQVTARQVGLVSSRSVSSPVSLNITLGDLNDNPPQLVNSTLGPVALAANSQASGSQQLVRLQALDRDLPENAQMHFSLRHVSNGARARFRIDEDSGQIEALGRFVAGEQFSLSVQVADDLGRASQGIVEVRVVPGANTGPPQFLAPETTIPAGETSQPEGRDSSSSPSSGSPGSRSSHGVKNYLLHESIEVNEAVPMGSQVTQVRAQDPENDPITYSLIGGNTNGDFGINSRTGSLVVANKLDREEISAYRLIVQARDSGGLATSRPLHIQVTDANDQNPIFTQDHYVFAVDEGVPLEIDNATTLPLTIGRVLAHDNDEGENGRVTYSLLLLAEGSTAPYAERGPPPPPPSEGNAPGQATPTTTNNHHHLFSVDEQTGEIKLRRPLDYELARRHTLMVVARDHGESPRSSSAMVQVKVLDRQDELPYFEQAHIIVHVDENTAAGQQVAQVQARDPDSVAQITYVLISGDPNHLFQVDQQTGQVTTTSAQLDYEQARSHSLFVGTNETLAALGNEAILAQFNTGDYLASDRQPPARVAGRWLVTRIDVHVNDLNDNAPKFESAGSPLLPVRVRDSLAPGSVLDVVHLQARDADGSPPNNQVKYELVTEPVAAAAAANGDSSQEWTYTNDKCAQLFLVDPATCQVSVRQDLRSPHTTTGPGQASAISECHLVIRARDMPLDDRSQKSLSSQVTLTVYIDHLAKLSASSMLAFADTSYTVELAENVPAQTLVRVLPVINKPKVGEAGQADTMLPMSCELISGNELNRFYVTKNELGDCELRTRDNQLDYEQHQRYLLSVRLNSFGGVAGAQRHLSATTTHVQVNLLDRNDNWPVFVEPPSRYGQLTQKRYLAAIARDAPPDTQVAQLRASDADSPQANGLISYELSSGVGSPASSSSSSSAIGSNSTREPPGDEQMETRFRVDPMDGILRTSKPIDDLPATRFPIRLRVVARDNPEQTSDTLETSAELIVNLIEDQHRLVLVLRDTPPSRVLTVKDQLLGVLQERTGLISGLERVESMRVQRNASFIEIDIGGTDVWFYLVEPGSLRLVTSDDPRLKAALFEGRAQNSLADILSQTLALTSEVRARVRLPYALINALSATTTGSGPASLFFGAFRSDSRDRLPPTLILIALVIAVASVIVVIYQCGSVAGWSESSARQQHAGAAAAAAAAAAASQQVFLPQSFGGHPSLVTMPQQQHFSKEKFMFSQLPPPPPTGVSLGQYQYPGSQMGDIYAQGHRLSDGSGMGTRSSFTSGQADNWQRQHSEAKQAALANESHAKEYETQMLKMSVLFDDSQSFVDRECLTATDYGENKNLVA